ncbi:hypothetical protein HHK36_030077 [Tetracentron sinense]|uniref:Uncharacterized protein n=1 Tax=Tetracentron sinense TaxID=13715 RepID=A0A834YAL8_TETSI|nr:hypothetical protein HHK36_030077 [Tetracentron sinense]
MEEDEISGGLNEWEQIQSSSSAQNQIHSSPWEMVVIPESLFEDSFVFPPSNHEALPISHGLHDHQAQQEQEPEPDPSSSSSLSDDYREDPVTFPLDSRRRFAGDIVRRLNFGFELLSSKILHIASSVRSYTASRGRVWSFVSATGVVAALLLTMLYVTVQRWRRRFRQENKDCLILLIKQKR